MRADWSSDLMRLGLFVLLGFCLLLPLSLHATSRLPDDGDALQNLWILWWGATHLHLGYPEIFEANVYYPHPGGLLYSEPQLTTALLASPLFHLLENRVLVYNLVTLFGLALSGFAAFLLYRDIVGDSHAALVGGALFGFNAYQLSQLPRSQLVQAQWIPLGLFFLYRYCRRPSVGHGLVFIVTSLLVGLSSFYYLLFYLVALVVLAPAFVLGGWPALLEARPRDVVIPLVAGLVGAGLFALVALPYVELFDRYGFVSSAPETMDLVSFFLPPAENPLYGTIAQGRIVDYFLGFVPLLLVLAGVVSLSRGERRVRHRAVWIGFGLITVLAFVFASGPELVLLGHRLGEGPFRWLGWFGPFEKLRDPTRFAVLVYLGVGLFASQGVSFALGAFPKWKHALVASLTLFVLLEQWSPRRTRGVEIPTDEDIPEAYRWLATDPPGGPVVELPVRPFHEIRYTGLEAYFSTFHERPVPFGKPSFYPPALELLQWELRNFPDDSSVAILRSLGIDVALVHPKRWREHRSLYLRRLRRRDDLILLNIFADQNLPLWERYRLGGERAVLVTGGGDRGEPRSCDCVELDRRGWKLKANGAVSPELAVDGERLTAWTTLHGQQEGHFFEITFDRPRRPARVEIEMAFSYGEFPRNLEMNGYVGPRARRVRQIEDIPYKIALIEQLVEDPTKARLRYDLEPMVMERLRLFIHRTESGTIAWSIPEIHVYESLTEAAPESSGESVW